MTGLKAHRSSKFWALCPEITPIFFGFITGYKAQKNTNSPAFTQLEIITIFMILNGTSPGLMTAFYNAGNIVNVETLLNLHQFFIAMWDLYCLTDQWNLLAVFGSYFTFDCASRTLQRIDGSLVQRNRPPRLNLGTESFVPNSIDWRRGRAVRNLIRTGRYRISDVFDLNEARSAMGNGPMRRG